MQLLREGVETRTLLALVSLCDLESDACLGEQIEMSFLHSPMSNK